MKGVREFDPSEFAKIKKKYFNNWTETEIKLRICRLFKVYNIQDYKGIKFGSKEDILEEARKNKEEGRKDGKLVGGVFYNKEKDESQTSKVAQSFFNKSKNKQ